MQVANPSRYTSNCILLREKLLLHQSVQRPHFDHQALQLPLGPLENTLCGGQPAALVLTDVKTGDTRCINPESTGLFPPCAALGGGGVLHPRYVRLDPNILES